MWALSKGQEGYCFLHTWCFCFSVCGFCHLWTLPLFSGKLCLQWMQHAGTTPKSCGGCLSSHVPHSRQVFLILSNGMLCQGEVYAIGMPPKRKVPDREWLKASYPLTILGVLIPSQFPHDKYSSAYLLTTQLLLVLISTTSQEIGMQIVIFCWVMCAQQLFPKRCTRLMLLAVPRSLLDDTPYPGKALSI